MIVYKAAEEAEETEKSPFPEERAIIIVSGEFISRSPLFVFRGVYITPDRLKWRALVI